MHTPPCARGRPPAQGKARQQRASSRGPLEHFFLPPQHGSGEKRRWQKARPRRICRVAAAMICGCSRSLFRCACGSFRCQKRLQCSRHRATTVLKSRPGRAAMEGRPVVRRWRRLTAVRPVFVTLLASCLGLYALHEGFQSSEDSICCARRISIPWSGKALKRSSRLRIPTESASEYQTGDLYARVQVQCHLSLTLIWE